MFALSEFTDLNFQTFPSFQLILLLPIGLYISLFCAPNPLATGTIVKTGPSYRVPQDHAPCEGGTAHGNHKNSYLVRDGPISINAIAA